MISEKALREKLQGIWKRHPPVTPASFAEADALINEIIEAATITEEAVAEEEVAEEE